MPYHWARIASSPPQQRRNEVGQICQRHDARLCENEIFYDEAGDVHALIEVPDDPAKQQALLDELGALESVGKVDAGEKEAGKNPPKSKPQA
jgi:hypothetical protein